MSGKRHIVYITGTRADFGLMQSALCTIARHPRLRLSVIATGMHLMPTFGTTIDAVKKAGYPLHIVDATYEKDDPASMATFAGKATVGIALALQRLRPDIVLLLGDRAEMLAAATAATYLRIPIAHIHGGDVSGTVDEPVRHAITKLAHLHFPATGRSARRLMRMGEAKRRVHIVGAPGLDALRTKKLARQQVTALIGTGGPYALVVQHPVSGEHEAAGRQAKMTLDAVASFPLHAVVVYPNADAGGRKMVVEIERRRTDARFTIFRNVPREEFLGLMRHAAVMVGNSSAGIIEAASFGTPVVNIGGREEGRERSCNVIDAPHEPRAIRAAIAKAMSVSFSSRARRCVNRYGDGKSGERIAATLATVTIDKGLLEKRIA